MQKDIQYIECNENQNTTYSVKKQRLEVNMNLQKMRILNLICQIWQIKFKILIFCKFIFTSNLCFFTLYVVF